MGRGLTADADRFGTVGQRWSVAVAAVVLPSHGMWILALIGTPDQLTLLGSIVAIAITGRYALKSFRS